MAGTNPRAARIAALIQRVIASSMEAQLHDKRLTNVTITEVRVTNDLQIAKDPAARIRIRRGAGRGT